MKESCYLCKKKTDSLAANPSVWPIYLGYPGGNGKSRVYCQYCVEVIVNEYLSLNKTPPWENEQYKI